MLAALGQPGAAREARPRRDAAEAEKRRETDAPVFPNGP
jgi:hypothetical protein